MGRQINYYMDKEVENRFIAFLLQSGYKILYDDTEEEEIKDIINANDIKEYGFLYIYKELYGEIVYNEHYGWEIIDEFNSPVFEFSRTQILEDKKGIREGRIWVNTNLEFENPDIKEQFLKDYGKLVRWIKKNVPYQIYSHNGQDRKGYINDSIMQYIQMGYKFIY